MPTRNLFHPLPEPAQGECFEELLHQDNVRIERIVSSPNIEPHTYCQEQDEWVALLQGQAQLEIDKQTITMNAGDTQFIPAQTPHKVLATSSEPLCIWLAIHIFPRQGSSPAAG